MTNETTKSRAPPSSAVLQELHATKLGRTLREQVEALTRAQAAMPRSPRPAIDTPARLRLNSPRGANRPNKERSSSRSFHRGG